MKLNHNPLPGIGAIVCLKSTIKSAQGIIIRYAIEVLMYVAADETKSGTASSLTDTASVLCHMAAGTGSGRVHVFIQSAGHLPYDVITLQTVT